ncbi:MAG: acyltransferase [Muribaculaceae bacterium]|nr:acyltransferase [Muribaculaceae bacterium]
MASKRQANFELLRIVAMLMIITLHYLVKGNIAAPYEQSQTAVNYAAWLIEAFCIVSVNCYVLLSGYFLVESEWKPGRLWELLCQVLFYSILVPVAMLGMGMIAPGELDIYDWITFILPIGTEHYWFASAYVILYLFAPLLAAGVKKLEQKTLGMIIAGLLFFFSFGKSILPVALVTDSFGYHYGWFLCLFLVAAYLRLYGVKWLEKKRRGMALYAVMCLCIFILSLVSFLLEKRVGLFSYYKDMPYTYNHICCLLGAVGLFSVFRNLRMWDGRAAGIIRKLAPYTFGVYLLHEHILVRYEWMEWLQVGKVRGTWLFLPHMAGCVLIVYFVGTIVDFVRAYLFVRIGRRQWKK